MAHYTLIARLNAGNGKFLFVNVQFAKNHRPIPIEGATYYLRPTSRGKRTPIRIGTDVTVAHTAMLNMDSGRPPERPIVVEADPPLPTANTAPRKTVEQVAPEYIERSKQKSRKTYLGYRTAVNLFVASCKKTYFDEICRDDMLDFLHELRTRPSMETGQAMGESTVFDYFLKTMVFLSDRGIGKYVAREDWVQKKDWPVNVDKRNKNKKYAAYTEQEVAAMIQIAGTVEETLVRFLGGTGFRIGEAAVAEWIDINWEDKTLSVRFKPKFGFKPKDYEERTIAVGDTLLACLEKYRRDAPSDGLIFPSPSTNTVDKHFDRIVNGLLDRANEAGYSVKRPKEPCHAFRMLYATRRYQHGVTSKPCGRNLGIQISRPLKSIYVRKIRGPKDIAPESMRLIGSPAFPPASLPSSSGVRARILSHLPVRKELLVSNNGCTMLHIWRVSGGRHGNSQSTRRRNCLGKADRSLEQRCPEALGTCSRPSVLENPRPLGITRRRRPAIARRYVQWCILRIEAKGPRHVGPGSLDEDFHPDRDL
jgi:integrase